MNYSTWLRIKTVARAWPTWVTAAAAVATIVADEVAKVAGAESPAAVVAVRVAAWLGAAVAIIRRSTPVRREARGVLPTGEPVTETERMLGDAVRWAHDEAKGVG